MAKPDVVVRVREATREDIPALIELNRAAYPANYEDHADKMSPEDTPTVWRPGN